MLPQAVQIIRASRTSETPAIINRFFFIIRAVPKIETADTVTAPATATMIMVVLLLSSSSSLLSFLLELDGVLLVFGFVSGSVEGFMLGFVSSGVEEGSVSTVLVSPQTLQLVSQSLS